MDSKKYAFVKDNCFNSGEWLRNVQTSRKLMGKFSLLDILQE